MRVSHQSGSNQLSLPYSYYPYADSDALYSSAAPIRHPRGFASGVSDMFDARPRVGLGLDRSPFTMRTQCVRDHRSIFACMFLTPLSTRLFQPLDHFAKVTWSC